VPKGWFEQNAPQKGGWFEQNKPTAEHDSLSLEGVPGADPGMQTPGQVAGIAHHPPLHGTSINYGKLIAAGEGAKDLYTGVGRGFASTANNIGHVLYPDAIAKHLTGAPSKEQQESYFRPRNGAEAFGKGAEQIGEYFLPAGAEEHVAAALPKAGKIVKPFVRSLMAEEVIQAQGGTPGVGGLTAGVGEGVGAGLRRVAPRIAESALGIRKADRAYGRTPGEAILNETKGIRPSRIAESAQDRLNELNPQLDEAVNRASVQPSRARALLTSGEMPLHEAAPYEQGVMMHPPIAGHGSVPGSIPFAAADLGPARQIARQAMDKAMTQNAPRLYNQIAPMQDSLLTRFDTGEPIQQFVTPRELLDLKRGFGTEHVHNWNPEIMGPAKGTGRQIYHALDQELDRTVPESADINQRISSLIPVQQRAESISREASIPQRLAGRFAAHTGALTMAGIGGTAGYHEYGVPGAIAGGIAGLTAPELIRSPEFQMLGARVANNAEGLRPIVAPGLVIPRTLRTSIGGQQQ